MLETFAEKLEDYLKEDIDVDNQEGKDIKVLSFTNRIACNYTHYRQNSHIVNYNAFGSLFNDVHTYN